MDDYSKTAATIRAITEKEAPETRRHLGIPSVTRLESGRMFSVFYGSELRGEGPGNYVVLATSTDNGLTWKEIQLAIIDGAPNERCFDSEIWAAPDGTLWWTWAQCLSIGKELTFDGRSGVWAARCLEPDTDNPVWEAPRRLSNGVMMCKPTVLKDGSWLFPVSFWACRPHLVPAELQDEQGANVLKSVDNGKTFRLIHGPRLALDVAEFDEHAIAELNDGRLMMIIRGQNGMWKSYSGDKGETWTAPEYARMGDANSRGLLMRLSSGNLLYVHHLSRVGLDGDLNGRWFREMLTAWLSKDDGKTWSGRLVLDERSDVSYPSGVEAKDGFIYVIYDHNRVKTGQILLARFKEKDLEEGEFVTPGAFTRLLVDSLRQVR